MCVLGCVMDDGKDVPKIDLKMSKNWSKTFNNVSTIEQIPTKIDRKLTENLSWRALGRVLGALGGQNRNGSKQVRFLEASWGCLGASWGRLGAWIAVLGRLGAVFGRLDGPKKRSQNQSFFGCLLGSEFL